MRVILFLKPFLPSGADVMTASCNNVVTTISRGIPDGFVFAHEEDCDRGGDATKGAWVSADVDIVPCPRVGETGLGVSAEEVRKV